MSLREFADWLAPARSGTRELLIRWRPASWSWGSAEPLDCLVTSQEPTSRTKRRFGLVRRPTLMTQTALSCRPTAQPSVDLEAVRATAAEFIGDIEQVPSTVSAIKIAGERAYAKARRGEAVDIPARAVTVDVLTVDSATRPAPDLLDVGIAVTCSSGTYIRALARDIGQRLGVGGHLTTLRRTRVGGFGLDEAVTLEDLEQSVTVMDLDRVVAATFPRRDVDEIEAIDVRHGRPLPLAGEDAPTGVFGPDGHVLAVMAPRDGQLRVAVGLTG